MALVVSSHQVLFAQSSRPDSVILKDHSFYFGFITEILPRDTVFIRSSLGNIYGIPVAQIERVYIRKPRIGTPIDNGPHR